MIKTTLPVFIFFVFCFNCKAQIGGDNTYEFLNLASSARIASLGGNCIAVKDNDLCLAYQNPSLLNSTMNNVFALSMVRYFADIKYGDVAYAHDLKNFGTWSAGIHYIDYGNFKETDVTGTLLGNFTAKEFSFNLALSKPLKSDSSFTIGAALKTIYSSLESYNSFGLAADVAGNYYNSEKMISVSLVVKNIGKQITTYTSGNIEPLPFEIQAGVSKQLKRAPFRASLIATHLEKFNINYTDPAKDQIDPLTGEKNNNKNAFGDKILRHMIINLEVLISKNFNLRTGYNFQRRKENFIETKRATVGLTWGFGIKISKFSMSYGRAAYHLAGASNHFSITTNFSDFGNKKKTAKDS